MASDDGVRAPDAPSFGARAGREREATQIGAPPSAASIAGSSAGSCWCRRPQRKVRRCGGEHPSIAAERARAADPLDHRIRGSPATARRGVRGPSARSSSTKTPPRASRQSRVERPQPRREVSRSLSVGRIRRAGASSRSSTASPIARGRGYAEVRAAPRVGQALAHRRRDPAMRRLPARAGAAQHRGLRIADTGWPCVPRDVGALQWIAVQSNVQCAVPAPPARPRRAVRRLDEQAPGRRGCSQQVDGANIELAGIVHQRDRRVST